jgi:hypothetical protein
LAPFHAIVHIHDAPIKIKPLPIFAPEPRAAAVVNVEHCNPAAGPELRSEVERARCRRGRAAVTFDEQRRPLVSVAGIIRIARRMNNPNEVLPPVVENSTDWTLAM